MTDNPAPRVDAHPLNPDQSAAISLCTFRLCHWASPDQRTLTTQALDDLIRAHLIDDHARELTVLGHLAADAGLIP